MSNGTCLCGKITWKIDGSPISAAHCHCRMCRKAHGAAFGTYYSVSPENFSWISGEEEATEYVSSDILSRAFCADCGAVVPIKDAEEGLMSVPAGSHVDGPAVSDHIFVGSKANWHEINDDLTQHDTYPGADDSKIVADKSLPPGEEGICRGSCLCGKVNFEINEPFKVVHNCHCSRCRQARAAAFTPNGFTSADGVKFVSGVDHIRTFKVPDAKFFTHVFCDTCGSGLPRIDDVRKIAVIPLGALDDDTPGRPVDHIFVRYKADWYSINDDLPAFEEMPG